MATLIIPPDSVVSSSGLTGSVTDIDSVSTVGQVINGDYGTDKMGAVNNNTNGVLRVSFPNQSVNMAKAPRFYIVAQQFDTGQNGDPGWIYISYDSSGEVYDPGGLGNPDFSVTNGPESWYESFDVSISSLGSNPPTGLELEIYLNKAGGSPSNRNTIDVLEVALVYIAETDVTFEGNGV